MPRFQSFGRDSNTLKNHFYEFDFGKKIILTNNFLSLTKVEMNELKNQAEIKHNMLEGAYLIKRDNFILENELLDQSEVLGYEQFTNISGQPFF